MTQCKICRGDSAFDKILMSPLPSGSSVITTMVTRERGPIVTMALLLAGVVSMTTVSKTLWGDLLK